MVLQDRSSLTLRKEIVMSTYYTFYLEAQIDGKWMCISPLVRLIGREAKEQNAGMRFAPVYSNSGGSGISNFLDSDLFYGDYSADFTSIDPELAKTICGEETYNKLIDPDFVPERFTNEEYVKNSFREIDGSTLVRMRELSKKKFDHAGYFERATAERIENEGAEYDEYPIYAEDLPKDLPEYMFNKLYKYIEYILPGGDVWFAREFMKEINSAIWHFNDENCLYGAKEVTLDKCRLIYYIS